eukprot:g20597.t1
MGVKGKCFAKVRQRLKVFIEHRMSRSVIFVGILSNALVLRGSLAAGAIFTPSNAGPRLRWIMQEHPLVLACLVASGPLWCVIAAATSWVIMDRFFIPLCYGTHFLVNVYFVSQFTSDVSSESDPEAPRSAQPAARGTASAEGEESEEVACVLEASPWDSAGELEWGSLPTQPTEASPGSACAQHAAPARPHAAPEAEESPVAQRRVHKDFLPGNMLRWGTKVVACFWASALLWAVHGAWFGMDFKNRKAAVPTWGDTPPLLEVSEMTMATPSPFWRPHALVCPRNQVFITDRYHVYELRENNTEVKRYPCSVNGTIADVAATCGRHSCWPVVLVKGVPPLVLDCSTGRSSPLLQTETRAGRIATSAQGTNGDTVGVLGMDLVDNKLLVFHQGGFVQVQDMSSGRLCSTFALDSSGAVIGGGCGNVDYSSILVLVKKGHGTALMRATLPSLKDCNAATSKSFINTADRWHAYDSFAITGSLIGVLVNASVAEKGVMTQILGGFQILRVLMLVRYAWFMDSITSTIWVAMPGLVQVCALLTLLMFMFACLGVGLFGTIQSREERRRSKRRAYTAGPMSAVVNLGDLYPESDVNFYSFGNAFMLLVRCATGERWHDIMYDIAEDKPGCTVEPQSYEDQTLGTRAAT